jgi:hypothetical protein
MTINNVADGDPIAIADTLLRVRGMAGTSIAAAKYIGCDKFRFKMVASQYLARAPRPTPDRNLAVSLGLSDNASFREIRRALLKEIKARKTAFATGADEAVFYSGQFTDGFAFNSEYAMGYANANGKKTIFHTDGGAWLNGQIADLRARFGSQIGEDAMTKIANKGWEAASHHFTMGASGSVTAFTAGASVKSVYSRIEMPRLKSSGGIAVVTTILPQ